MAAINNIMHWSSTVIAALYFIPYALCIFRMMASTKTNSPTAGNQKWGETLQEFVDFNWTQNSRYNTGNCDLETVHTVAVNVTWVEGKHAVKKADFELEMFILYNFFFHSVQYQRIWQPLFPL